MDQADRHAVVAVSIHAPARGRTRLLAATAPTQAQFQSTPPHEGERLEDQPVVGSRLRFNPRPRTRANPTSSGVSAWSYEFQSTPPHEGEPDRHGDPAGAFCFNPRPRTRANHLP